MSPVYEAWAGNFASASENGISPGPIPAILAASQLARQAGVEAAGPIDPPIESGVLPIALPRLDDMTGGEDPGWRRRPGLALWR